MGAAADKSAWGRPGGGRAAWKQFLRFDDTECDVMCDVMCDGGWERGVGGVGEGGGGVLGGSVAGERLGSWWEDGWEMRSKMVRDTGLIRKTLNQCRLWGTAGSGLRLVRPTGQPTPMENNFWSPSGATISHTQKKKSNHDGRGICARTPIYRSIASSQYREANILLGEERTSPLSALPLSLWLPPTTTTRGWMDWGSHRGILKMLHRCLEPGFAKGGLAPAPGHLFLLRPHVRASLVGTGLRLALRAVLTATPLT